MTEFEFLTREHDAVAIVDVRAMDGMLTPSLDWIFSRVNADVVEVLKPSAGGQLLDGQRSLNFLTSGGVGVVNGTTVSTLSNFGQLEAGRRYLVFMFADESGLLRAAPYGQFELSGNLVKRLDERDTPAVLDRTAADYVGIVRATRQAMPVYRKAGVR